MSDSYFPGLNPTELELRKMWILLESFDNRIKDLEDMITILFQSWGVEKL